MTRTPTERPSYLCAGARGGSWSNAIGGSFGAGGLAAPTLDSSGRMTPITGTPPLEWLSTWGLRQIAEAAGGRYWEAESPARLKAAFRAVTETMAQRYVLTYEPEGVKRPGWHEIDLRLRGRKGEVHTRRGYWVQARTSSP